MEKIRDEIGFSLNRILLDTCVRKSSSGSIFRLPFSPGTPSRPGGPGGHSITAVVPFVNTPGIPGGP